MVPLDFRVCSLGLGIFFDVPSASLVEPEREEAAEL